MKLWTGRLSGSMDALAARLNNSLPFDQRLAQVDVRGSIAWARALARRRRCSLWVSRFSQVVNSDRQAGLLQRRSR